MMLVFCLMWLLAAPWTIHGQGLRPDVESLARSGTTFATFSQAYRDSSAWRSAMKTSKRTACSMNSGSLCGSASEEAALLLATAPQAYDARSNFSSVQVVGPVKNQGSCGMCVAFAVLAAAQTAAAVGLRQSLTGTTLSEQDFYLCLTVPSHMVRGCSTGWSIEKGMFAFAELQVSKRLPVVEACRRYDPLSTAPCRRSCITTLPQLLQGSHKVKPLSSIVEMQRHIRQQGSIVCRMQLFSDIKPFFAASPGGVYRGPGKGATMEDAHSVQVVGYDNTRQAWLIKNSWGPGFAAKGFAWVAFDSPSICDPRDTYGFVFVPSQPRPVDPVRLAPAPGRKGCYTYKAVAGDYPEGVATLVGIPVQRLLLDNLDAIKDPSTLPAGTTLLLCGVSPAGVADTIALPAAASSPADEVAALLAIKDVLNPPGTALKDWQPGSPSPCGWTGVTCDAGGKRVTKIDFWDAAAGKTKVQLFGQLPSGALLRPLPGLVVFGLGNTGVRGPVPEDWSQLRQLEGIHLHGNQLTGTLPPSWAALTKLKQCLFSDNKLSGPLPGSWSGMATLEHLGLHSNALTGTLPPSWAALTRLGVCALLGNKLRGPLPRSWSGMTMLGVLSLETNALTGTLPPSWAALTKLRVCNLWGNKLSGPLPGSWSGMAAMEELLLSHNALTGTLPPSWAALTKLKACWLYDNKLRGPLPGSWSRMAALKWLDLSSNALAGTVPASWGSWRSVDFVRLYANPQLSGCVPAAWRGRVNVGQKTEFGPYEGGDPLTSGTGITGFC